MLVDYHIHGMGHRDFPHSVESLARFVEAALGKGIAEVGFADHDYYLRDIRFSNFEELRTRFPGIGIKVGLEVEFFPGQETETNDRLAGCRFDYLIGSVHYIGEWLFDHPDYIEGFSAWDIDQLYRVYFGLVARMARTRLFDMVGHLDLIKIFGHRAKSPVLKMVQPTLEEIRDSGMVIEVNTAGLHRPVQEQYPAKDLLKAAFQMGIPITLSSDAHAPEQVGRDLLLAREMAREVGYREAATFSGRERIMVPL
ncbi:MAG: histidinol-phosphatase HisJ family protein [Firmicutes bacterium]|nr:histidinol-phosphatase HisJ family protein [Bacillota bacterium]